MLAWVLLLLAAVDTLHSPWHWGVPIASQHEPCGMRGYWVSNVQVLHERQELQASTSCCSRKQEITYSAGSAPSAELLQTAAGSAARPASGPCCCSTWGGHTVALRQALIAGQCMSL